MSQLKCSLIKQKVFKSTQKLPGEIRIPVSWVTGRDTYHYTTEDCCLVRFVAVHFLSQLSCTLIKQKVFKSTHNLPGGESNPGLLRDSQRYLPLYYRGLLFTDIFCSSFPEPTEQFINKTKGFQKHTKVPRRKIESRSPEWQLETLTAILLRISVTQYLLQFISWANWNVH